MDIRNVAIIAHVDHGADECVEMTPAYLRMRKFLLDENARKRQAKQRRLAVDEF